MSVSKISSNGSSPLSPVRQGQVHTMNKMARGTESGSLTGQEAGKVMKGVHQLASAAKQAHADGNVSMQEAMKLGQMKQKNAAQVHRLNNNDNVNSFAPFSPVAQNQAKQLRGLADSMKQPGTISNQELRGAMHDQRQIAEARPNMPSLGNRDDVLNEQKVSGLKLQLANLTSNGV
jgi:hypothetical protein